MHVTAAHEAATAGDPVEPPPAPLEDLQHGCVADRIRARTTRTRLMTGCCGRASAASAAEPLDVSPVVSLDAMGVPSAEDAKCQPAERAPPVTSPEAGFRVCCGCSHLLDDAMWA